MDLLLLGRAFLRRWYVVVPLLATVLTATWWLTERAVPTYEVEGTLLLIDRAPVTPNGSGWNRPQALVEADALAQAMRAPEVVTAITAEAGAGTYDVAGTGYSSTVSVTAYAPAPADAVAIANLVLAEMPARYDDLQDSLGVEDAWRSRVIVLKSAAQARRADAGEPGAGSLARGDQTYVAEAIASLQAPPVLQQTPGTSASSYTARVASALTLDATFQATVLQEQEGSFTVTADRLDAAPMLEVAVSDSSPRAVNAIFDRVVFELREHFASSTVGGGAGVDLTVLAQSAAERTSPPISRAAAIVLAAGLASIAGLVLLIEGIADARRRSRGGARIEDRDGTGIHSRSALSSDPSMVTPPPTEQRHEHGVAPVDGERLPAGAEQ
jgi:hypothetical protein